MRKAGSKWKCGAVCVTAAGFVMAAIGGVQLATGIAFTFFVPLFHTGSNIGVGFADILFGLLISYLASNGRNKPWKMKMNLFIATLVGLINLGNIILMELGEWRLFEPNEQVAAISEHDPHLVTVAYFSTTLPAALVLVLAIVDVEYVGCSLVMRTPKKVDVDEPTLKLRFSSESVNSSRHTNTQTSLFGWVFGGQDVAAHKSNTSVDVVHSSSSILGRKFNTDAMELLYQGGDNSSNDSDPVDKVSTFTPMTVKSNNWTLQTKDTTVALNEGAASYSVAPQDLETPPQTEFMQPQTANYAPFKNKKSKAIPMKTTKPCSLDGALQKATDGSNSPFFCENPEKFLAAKLLAEAVCSSRNNNDDDIVPVHNRCSSVEYEDFDDNISVPKVASTPKPIQDELLLADPDSLVQLSRLELIARQWRVAAQHREIHSRVSQRLNKAKMST